MTTALMLTPTTTDLWGWLILGVLTVIVTAALLCAWDLAVGWLQRRRADAAELDLYLRRQRTRGMGDPR